MKELNMETIKVRFPDETRWEKNEDELTFWPRAMWIDPGISTGLTILWFDPVILLQRPAAPTHRAVIAWWTDQLVGHRNAQVLRACNIVKLLGGEVGLLIGIEDFILRTSNQDRAALEPIRWTHSFEFALWRGLRDHDGVTRRRGYVVQSPADAKTRFGDDRLRPIGLYTPGPDHIRDSTRHALLWLTKLRVEETNHPGFFQQTHGLDEEWFT